MILSYIAAQVLPWAAGLPVLIGLLIWSHAFGRWHRCANFPPTSSAVRRMTPSH
ncbi:hypothetical protein ACTMU2_30785 [Cupriavidus basilensis]